MAPCLRAVSLAFVFLLCFSLVAAVGLDNPNLPIVRPDVVTFDNATGSVNASAHWITISLGALDDANTDQFNDIGGTLTIDESHFDLRWCALTGCNMTGDLMVDADLIIHDMPDPALTIQRDDAGIGSTDTIGKVWFRGGDIDLGRGELDAYKAPDLFPPE